MRLQQEMAKGFRKFSPACQPCVGAVKCCLLTRHIEHPRVLQVEPDIAVAQRGRDRGIALVQLLRRYARVEGNRADHLTFIVLGHGYEHQFRYGCIAIGGSLRLS